MPDCAEWVSTVVDAKYLYISDFIFGTGIAKANSYAVSSVNNFRSND
jgi:hypothetical protein